MNRGPSGHKLDDNRSASGNATPQSGVVNTGRSSPSGLRSGYQTPINPVLAMPSFSANSNESNKETVDLSRMLLEFSQATKVNTIRAINYTEASGALKKQMGDLAKWQFIHGEFDSLKEEQERSIRKAQENVDICKEKFDRSENVVTAVLQQMAKTLVSVNAGIPPQRPEDGSRIKDLQQEVKDLKAELHRISTEFQQFKTVDSKRLEMHKDVSNMTDKYTALKSEIRQLKSVASGRDPHDLREEAHLTTTKVGDLANMVEDLQSIKSGMNKLSQECDVLYHSHQELKSEFSTWKMDTDLCHIQQTSIAQESRLLTIESRQQDDQPVLLAPNVNEFREKLLEIEKDFEEAKREQLLKDDLVSEEMEKVQRSLSTLRSYAEDLVAKTNTTTSELQSVSKMQAQLAAQVQALWPSPSARSVINDAAAHQSNGGVVQVNGTRTTEPQSNTNVMDKLILRLQECEHMVYNLLQRFNHINTESMAKSMVNQMQVMYPYPAMIQHDLEALKFSSANVSTQIDKKVAESLEPVKNRIDGMALEMSSGKSKKMEETMENRYSSINTELSSIKRRMDTRDTDHAKEMVDLSTRIDDLSKNVVSLNKICGLTREQRHLGPGGGASAASSGEPSNGRAGLDDNHVLSAPTNAKKPQDVPKRARMDDGDDLAYTDGNHQKRQRSGRL
jgi:hypothetical protein